MFGINIIFMLFGLFLVESAHAQITIQSPMGDAVNSCLSQATNTPPGQLYKSQTPPHETEDGTIIPAQVFVVVYCTGDVARNLYEKIKPYNQDSQVLRQPDFSLAEVRYLGSYPSVCSRTFEEADGTATDDYYCQIVLSMLPEIIANM